MKTVTITDEDVGKRVDVIVAAAIGMGRAGARRLIADGQVRLRTDLGSHIARKGDRAALNNTITIDLEDADAAGARPEAAEIDIVFQSPSVVVINKPAGMPSAPLRRGETGTAANALVHRFPEMAEVGYSSREPGLCHRLDTKTSGLLLAARNADAFTELTRAISLGHLDKRYLLVCPAIGRLDENGVIDRALESSGPHVRVARRGKGRPALTHYTTLERTATLALVEARACPASRHQIRAHFAHLKAPLIGDATYGGNVELMADRHALHASLLGYGGGEHVAAFEVESPLPEALRRLMTPRLAPPTSPEQPPPL